MKIKLCILVLCLFSLLIMCSCGKVNDEYIKLTSPIEETLESENTESDITSSEQTSDNNNTVNISFNNNELVRVKDHINNIKIDIKYATKDNFTGKVIYKFDDAYLRYGTVIKLKKAVEKLNDAGYTLLVWDAYRPQEAQFKLFEAKPNGNYVSDPNNGFSSHSSGATVDITLIKLDGSLVTMPSDFDEFSAKGDRDYSDVSEEAGENAKLLEKAMSEAGFKGYSKEWWHFSDLDNYDYDDIKNVMPCAKSKNIYTADCKEYISLRKSTEAGSEVVCKVPKDSELLPLSWTVGHVRVKYNEYIGFVKSDYVK